MTTTQPRRATIPTTRAMTRVAPLAGPIRAAAVTMEEAAATGRSVNRRQFVGAALLALPSYAAAGESIVDTHIHLYDPTRPQGVPWPPKDNTLLYRRTLPPDFRAATKGLGVTGAIVVEASAWLEDNQWVLDLAKDNPFILGFVGHLEPGDSSFRPNLRRFSSNPLFRGIRLGGRTIA